MKVLVLSSAAWSDDNCFGNCFSNLFGGMEELEIANIACRAGRPTEKLVTRCFQITEKSLLNNLKSKANPSGREIQIPPENLKDTQQEDFPLRKFGQKKRWQILFWGRDLIWAAGRWKSPELRRFLDDFGPDLIFQPIYEAGYLNDIAQYIKAYTKAPMIGYISDDCYTLKRLSFSPLYWLDRLHKRKKVKQTIEQCELLYVISRIQQEEYAQCFSVDCKVLTKHADFDAAPALKKTYHHPLQLVYTGNIGTNRWKSLKIIADVLESLNEKGIRAQLRIYTATPFSKKMKKALARGESSLLMGSVSAGIVPELQRNADILVHVEPLDLKHKLMVRHSFSTKIVDYLKAARPVLAVGPKDVASIDHLIRNDCAIAAEDKAELERKLRDILRDTEALETLAVNAYKCGGNHHNRRVLQAMLRQDMERISGG